MNVNLFLLEKESIGYGRMGINLAEALRKHGLDVWTEMRETTTSNLACWVSTPSHARGWWKGQHTAMFTMWEASSLPESFRDSFHEFDTLLVPSVQNQEMFSEYHDNVRYVPLGIDPEAWKYRERLPHEDEFRFMTAGSGRRKGVDLVHKAFLTLWGKEGSWGSGPVPKLIMKNPQGEDYYGPRVSMVTGKIPPQEEIDLYAYAHCYVQASRGEGFGLQPLQAIAQGCPTILTAAHGHKAFFGFGWGIGYSMSPSEGFMYGDGGDWWEPDFDELVWMMKYHYENYDQIRRDAARSSDYAREQFTWAKTADRFVEAFPPEVFDDYTGPWEWHESQGKLYRIRVTSNRQVEIAGTRYVMVPDEDYWVPADVKRVLFDSGSLDPICIDDRDPGLTEAQLETRGLYHAKHAFCPTCSQQLNTRTTLADVYAELGS